MSRDLADQLVARTGALWNMYGPTETTIWSTISRIEGRTLKSPDGRPIANTPAVYPDRSLHPVPIGVPGGIVYLGGDGVALGYYKRADLTVERFIPDPFSDRPGARLYKTGDRGRYRSDGHVVHLGRLDHQVKIRGFRIELGKSKPLCGRMPLFGKSWSPHNLTNQVATSLWPTSSMATANVRSPKNCVPSLRRNCLITWCRRTSLRCRRFP